MDCFRSGLSMWILVIEYKPSIGRIRMQKFDTFLAVFEFFIKSQFDTNYVKKIDLDIKSNQASVELEQLVENVKSFHTMRQSMCAVIFEYFNNHPLLFELIETQSLEQYDTVSDKSNCIFTKDLLKQTQGITIVLKNNPVRIVTVHKRFKRILYNFWYLIHFTDEIHKEIKTWLVQQRWWRRGSNVDIVERIVQFQDNMFAKKAYVKLKGIHQYIQTEMAALPINQVYNKKE